MVEMPLSTASNNLNDCPDTENLVTGPKMSQDLLLEPP